MFNFQERDERRSFVHKKLLKIGTGFITGGPAGAATAGLSIIRSRNQRKTSSSAAANTAKFGGNPLGSGGRHPATPEEIQKFGLLEAEDRARKGFPRFGTPMNIVGGCPQTARCTFPARWDTVTCKCKIFLGDVSGRDPSGNGMGRPGAPTPTDHVHGHRAPVAPEVFQDSSTRSGVRLRCPRKFVLGEDDMCYFGLPRNSKWRKWSPGRRPIFTGGDLNAIKTVDSLRDKAEDIFKATNPAKKAVARNYRANWRKPLKK